MTIDSFAPRLSFFFYTYMNFFEEVAKYRAGAAHLGAPDEGEVRRQERPSRGACAPPACAAAIR